MIDLRFPWRVLPGVAAAANPDPEALLSERVAAGDADALEEAYDRFGPSLFRVLTAILGSTADAEDALQEVFCRLACGKAKRVRNLRAYLYTAARNEATSLLRRKSREGAFAEAEALEGDAAREGTPSYLHQHLLEMLQRLPLDQREVIAMRVFEQLTFEEIGQILAIPANTAASRFRYGIARVRSWNNAAEREAELIGEGR